MAVVFKGHTGIGSESVARRQIGAENVLGIVVRRFRQLRRATERDWTLQAQTFEPHRTVG